MPFRKHFLAAGLMVLAGIGFLPFYSGWPKAWAAFAMPRKSTGSKCLYLK